MTENFRPTVLRNKAWQALKGKWGGSALTCLVFMLIVGAASFIPSLFGSLASLASLAVSLFFTMIVSMGALFVWLDLSNGKNAEINTLFEPFNDYKRYLVGGLWVTLYVFLWTLLFVIPGIIKQISYSQTFYIMRDNPEMKGDDARKLSMKLMHGHKMDFFLLQLSFIGWVLLAILTFGIGMLWVAPYMYTAQGEFYKEIKKSAV